ncbi:hypothetical protein [Cohnella abietis]|uniref:Uncharacterized protein n=1 Tax=Cohnella abietis TaxID=2507935 RepID=A0A3T1D1M5_9BACL|nr:hypothetical protein [Cohnella abietis]BBI32022.1 hypothetical protein KCTCHS21_14210 [Cohnella abietis]
MNDLVIKMPNNIQLLRSEDHIWATRIGDKGLPITTDPEIVADDLEQYLNDPEPPMWRENPIMRALIAEIRLNVGMQRIINEKRMSAPFNQGEAVGTEVLSSQLVEEVKLHAETAAQLITMRGEATRLRDDITEAINIWEWMTPEDDGIDTIERVIRKLKQALSSHTEDTGIRELEGADKVRKLYMEWVDERKNPRDANFPGYEGIVENRIAQIEEVAELLGITIPGINTEEGQ